MNDITLGQFVPRDSFVHKLDPRIKLALLVVYIILVFSVHSLPLFIIPFLYSVIALVLSKISLGYIFRSLKPIRFLLIFMFILNLFITRGETVLFSAWIITITKEGLHQALFITLRLMLLVSGSSILTLTTSPLQLTNGFERIMSPLKAVRFPAHELAMMMTIALRFIPTLMEETEKIQKAQLSRGADFESGNPVARAKAMLPILIPLFVSAFRRADELAMAMESRCYHGGDGRTKLHELKYSRRDLFAILFSFAVLVLLIVLNRIV